MGETNHKQVTNNLTNNLAGEVVSDKILTRKEKTTNRQPNNLFSRQTDVGILVAV